MKRGHRCSVDPVVQFPRQTLVKPFIMSALRALPSGWALRSRAAIPRKWKREDAWKVVGRMQYDGKGNSNPHWY